MSAEEERRRVMSELKEVEEALQQEGGIESGVKRLLKEWDLLKTFVSELRVELKEMSALREEVKSLRKILREERRD